MSCNMHHISHRVINFADLGLGIDDHARLDELEDSRTLAADDVDGRAASILETHA
jgi:hypothetical protein